MFSRSLRVALLIGVVAAATASYARAQGHDACPPAGCGPVATHKVACTEYVPETYTAKRIVYKQVQKEECYTAYKCECVPEVRTRTCTVYRTVCEPKTICRDVCIKVPCWEDRVCVEKCYETVRYTEMCNRRRLHTYWECVEQPCHFTNLCNRLCHNSCDPCCQPCPQTRTVRRLRCCWVNECVPVCRHKRICIEKQVCKKVCTYRTEVRKETCTVNVTRCIPETRTENYTCYVTRKVPVQCKRMVCVCVPTEECYTCTRMVCRTVYRDVPCAPACCEPACGHRHGLFSGFNFNRGCGHHNSCGNGCY